MVKATTPSAGGPRSIPGRHNLDLDSTQTDPKAFSTSHPGVVGSGPRVAVPASVYCDWMRQDLPSATSISAQRHVQLFVQIRPCYTLPVAGRLSKHRTTPPLPYFLSQHPDIMVPVKDFRVQSVTSNFRVQSVTSNFRVQSVTSNSPVLAPPASVLATSGRDKRSMDRLFPLFQQHQAGHQGVQLFPLQLSPLPLGTLSRWKPNLALCAAPRTGEEEDFNKGRKQNGTKD